jgi:hypothetical protein
MSEVTSAGRSLNPTALPVPGLPDRLPVRIALPLIGGVSLVLWGGIYFGVRWAFGW